MADENVDGGSQNGADGVDGNPGNRSNAPVRVAKKPDPALSLRNQLLDSIDAQIAAKRLEENDEVMHGADPQAKAFLARAAAERGDSLEDAPGAEEAQDDTEVDGAAQEDEAATQRAEAVARAATKVRDGIDPLADYIVTQGGKPMFRTKVDGKEILIPVETARAQLQKHVAADIRLQDVANQRRDLERRRQNLEQSEAAFAVRSRGQLSGQPAADDQTLERESVELVRMLVSEPNEAVVAKKLTTVLQKVRQAAAPQIDTRAVAKEAASLARQEIAVDNRQAALVTGLSSFKKSYADIAADPDLYAMADRRTDAIAEEHQDWTPEQVMLEAGKQTRDWMREHGMKAVASSSSNAQPSGRQQRKDKLMPMPAARTARVSPTTEPDTDNSPQAALAEARKARGQFS